MRFHAYSEIFPLLEGAALDELAADIKAFGLREPIWTYQGQILDGRNRWLACQQVHVDPQCRTYKGTDAGALALVISANMRRRDLTPEQRALAAARVSTLRVGSNQHSSKKAALPDEGGSRGANLSVAEAAAQFDVSTAAVKRAKQVIADGSKPLQKAVESGEVSLRRAAAVMDKPKREQLAAAKAKPEKAAPPADLSEFIDEKGAEQEEREYADRIARVLDADDHLKQMNAELERAAKEIVALKQARDRYMNECGAMRKQLTAKDREIARLKKAAK